MPDTASFFEAHPKLRRSCALSVLASGLALLPVGCDGSPPVTEIEDSETPVALTTCECELRSWVVAGRGRHLFISIECPDPYQELSTIVEFTSEALRPGFVEPVDPIEDPPRVATMTRGVRLMPLAGEPDDRFEASYEITPEQAMCLQRVRYFEEPYILIGTNSNSGMRTACAECEITLPERVLESYGVLGEFPGVNYTLTLDATRSDSMD